MTVEVEDDEALARVGPVPRRRCGRSPADDFPRLTEPEGAGVTVEAGPLADALRQVVPAASRDDARPILTGVLLDRHGRRRAPGRHRLVPARGP